MPMFLQEAVNKPSVVLSFETFHFRKRNRNTWTVISIGTVVEKWALKIFKCHFKCVQNSCPKRHGVMNPTKQNWVVKFAKSQHRSQLDDVDISTTSTARKNEETNLEWPQNCHFYDRRHQDVDLLPLAHVALDDTLHVFTSTAFNSPVTVRLWAKYTCHPTIIIAKSSYKNMPKISILFWHCWIWDSTVFCTSFSILCLPLQQNGSSGPKVFILRGSPA